jgi:shikimate kinase/3-dehydroquinate synthase
MPLKNLVLIGMPGSGKTTLGKLLAKRSGMPFIDTDIIIEQMTGERISDIFAKNGEGAFRAMEREVVEKASGMRGAIIATGGGAWMDERNRARLKDSGSVVYLSCPPEVLWERLQGGSTLRPLLKDGPVSLEGLYHKRHPFYMTADRVVEACGKTEEECADLVLAAAGINKQKDSTENTIHRIRLSFGDMPYCDIAVGSGIIKDTGVLLDERLAHRDNKPRLMVISNPFVNALCGEKLCDSLERSGFEVNRYLIPDGEEHKSLEQLSKVYSHLAGAGFGRGDLILAFGGGVTGDLAGFAAATYMRGIGVIQVPTTLLAQVDSSIGGKTAVNLPEGKNLVGAFHQPHLVVSDTRLLTHLSGYQFRQGLGECIKYGLLDEGELFRVLENNAKDIQDRDPGIIADVVQRCCRIKAGIVEKDEKERGLRRLLNLGHTIGHALEAAAGYGRLGHGDAVALGLRAKASISKETGIMSEGDFERITALLDVFGFPKKGDFSAERVKEYLARDKKKKSKKILFVFPKGIGKAVEVCEMPPGALEQGLRLVGCK